MPTFPTWRDRTAAALLVLAALGALVSFITSFPTIAAASPTAQVAETWRAFGFVVFTGLFLLLAFRPRHYPGVWELTIFHKVAVAFTAGFLLGAEAVDARMIALVDGVLALMLIAAYVLAQGYAAWRRPTQHKLRS